MSDLRILVVEDEPQIVRALRPTLLANGYQVDVAETAERALSLLAADGADIVLLDLGLPDLDGKDVIRKVREWADVPIVVLSARDIESEKIEALDLGADDYINKPFSAGEMLARIRVALRGRERRLSRTVLETGDLMIDIMRRRVTLGDDEVRLRPKEFALLAVLARHAGRIVTHKQIAFAVWGQERVDPQFIRVLVGHLRSKVEADPARPRLVITEPNLGYRLTIEET